MRNRARERFSGRAGRSARHTKAPHCAGPDRLWNVHASTWCQGLFSNVQPAETQRPGHGARAASDTMTQIGNNRLRSLVHQRRASREDGLMVPEPALKSSLLPAAWCRFPVLKMYSGCVVFFFWAITLAPPYFSGAADKTCREPEGLRWSLQQPDASAGALRLLLLRASAPLRQGK